MRDDDEDPDDEQRGADCVEQDAEQVVGEQPVEQDADEAEEHRQQNGIGRNSGARQFRHESGSVAAARK
ncbi:hypothetical protein D9M69_689340 [compost metagenome]